MIDFDLFHFASAPRTATTWIRQAAAMAGLRENGRNEVHHPHDSIQRGVLKVCCVRHPFEWLRSYYSAIKFGHVDVPEIDCLRMDRSTGFDDFVRYYLDHHPGQVSKIFIAYHADTCLRVEDLPWAFVSLLESLDVPRGLRERCLVLNEQNITSPRNKPRWSHALYERVVEAEREFMERYEYV